MTVDSPLYGACETPIASLLRKIHSLSKRGAKDNGSGYCRVVGRRAGWVTTLLLIWSCCSLGLGNVALGQDLVNSANSSRIKGPDVARLREASENPNRCIILIRLSSVGKHRRVPYTTLSFEILAPVKPFRMPSGMYLVPLCALEMRPESDENYAVGVHKILVLKGNSLRNGEPEVDFAIDIEKAANPDLVIADIGLEPDRKEQFVTDESLIVLDKRVTNRCFLTSDNKNFSYDLSARGYDESYFRSACTRGLTVGVIRVEREIFQAPPNLDAGGLRLTRPFEVKLIASYCGYHLSGGNLIVDDESRAWRLARALKNKIADCNLPVLLGPYRYYVAMVDTNKAPCQIIDLIPLLHLGDATAEKVRDLVAIANAK